MRNDDSISTDSMNAFVAGVFLSLVIGGIAGYVFYNAQEARSPFLFGLFGVLGFFPLLAFGVGIADVVRAARKNDTSIIRLLVGHLFGTMAFLTVTVLLIGAFVGSCMLLKSLF